MIEACKHHAYRPLRKAGPMYVCNPKGLGALHVCRNLLYTPLESGFTGKSLTIPDFVRGTLFTEFGEFLFYSENVFGFIFNGFCLKT